MQSPIGSSHHNRAQTGIQPDLKGRRLSGVAVRRAAVSADQAGLARQRASNGSARADWPTGTSVTPHHLFGDGRQGERRAE